MQIQMEKLLAKQQASVVNKPLTHGHLNRLNKLKAQVATAGKKVVTLDQEWAKFTEQTMDKVKQHAQLYQSCRAEMLEIYNGKLEELANLKREVTAASMSMLDGAWKPPEIMHTPKLEEAVSRMQEVIEVEGSVGAVDLTEEMEEDDQEELIMSGSTSKGLSKTLNRPFRGAASPTKVANQHLKQKAQELKDAKLKDKDKEERT